MKEKNMKKTEITTLEEARSAIDKVDNDLKEAFLARMELVDRIAVIKAGSGSQVYNPDREKAMIRRLTADVEPRFRESYIRFLEEMLCISKEYQKKRMEQEKP